MRDALAGAVPFSSLGLAQEALARDGTEKALPRTRRERTARGGGAHALPRRAAFAVPVDQSGCPLTCSFCATGRMRFGRNLTASEILDQALHFRRKEAVDHAVFMGMGEPLMNLDNVLAACERLPEMGSPRRTPRSRRSAGCLASSTWRARVRRYASPCRCTQPTRRCAQELMPVNDRYPLRDVLGACVRWHERRRRQVFVEYLMLDGINDRYEQAVALARLLEPRHAFKVDLIPYNPTEAGLARIARDAIAAFRSALERRGVRGPPSALPAGGRSPPPAGSLPPAADRGRQGKRPSAASQEPPVIATRPTAVATVKLSSSSVTP